MKKASHLGSFFAVQTGLEPTAVYPTCIFVIIKALHPIIPNTKFQF